jgi:hypothetical protein
MKRYIEVFLFWLLPIGTFVFGAVLFVEWLVRSTTP